MNYGSIFFYKRQFVLLQSSNRLHLIHLSQAHIQMHQKKATFPLVFIGVIRFV